MCLRSVCSQATLSVVLNFCVVLSNVYVIVKWFLGRDTWEVGVSSPDVDSNYLCAGIATGGLVLNGLVAIRKASTSGCLFPMHFIGLGAIPEAVENLRAKHDIQLLPKKWAAYLAYFFVTTLYSAFFMGILELFYMVLSEDYHYINVINYALNVALLGYTISLSIRQYPNRYGCLYECIRQLAFWLNSAADFLFRTVPLALYFFKSKNNGEYWHWVMLAAIVLFEVGILTNVLRADYRSIKSLILVLPWAIIQSGSHYAVWLRVVECLRSEETSTPMVLYIELVVRALFSILLYFSDEVAVLTNATDEDPEVRDYIPWFWTVVTAAGVNLIFSLLILCDVARLRRKYKCDQDDETAGWQGAFETASEAEMAHPLAPGSSSPRDQV